MTRRRGPPPAGIAALAAGAALALAAPSFADDPGAPRDPASPESVWEEVSGEIRAGWRFLEDEGDGRFLQDHALAEGPQLFDFVASGRTAEGRGWLDAFEAEAHGIGDEEQDARFAVRKDGVLDVRGGWMRDDFSYRATGDPFPYDTVRERWNLRSRWTPDRNLTVRLDWDRSERMGDAYTSQFNEAREPPYPSDVDELLVADHRPIRQRHDTITLGADARLSGWRLTLQQSARIGDVDDRREYDVPPSLRGPAPLSQDFRRDLRTTAWTTLAKAGTSFFRDRLDVNVIASWTRQPTESRIDSEEEGYESAFDSGGIAPRGAYDTVTSGENDLDRTNVLLRAEASWRVRDDVEIVGAYEQDDTTDDAELRLVSTRDYDRPDLGPETTRTSFDARITDRAWRGSLEAAWDVTEDVRVRLGEEMLRQELKSPTDTRGDDLAPTAFDSLSWRTIVGLDVEPAEGLDLGVLAKFSRNDDPHAAPSPEAAQEVSFRGRWRAAESLTLTAAYRHLGYTHSDDYDSASRTDSGTVAAVWASGPWSVAPSVTYQTADTRTDTSYYSSLGGSFDAIDDQVSFATRDLIVSLDLEYAFAGNLRGFLRGTRIDARGDEEEVWDEMTLGAEYDVRGDLTVGAALRSFRLNEDDGGDDDYRVLGAEVWVTLKF